MPGVRVFRTLWSLGSRESCILRGVSLRGFVTACAPVAFTGLIALSSAPACSNTAGVSEVYTSLDGDGSRRRDTFFTDSTEIHCIVKAQFGRPDVTIRGVFRRIRKWDPTIGTDGDFKEVDEYASDIDFHPDRTADRKEPTVIDFAMTRLDASGAPSDKVAFVAGSYICTIEIDGVAIDTKAPFNIEFPECPQASIATGSTCLGYFKPDTECPRDGLKSRTDKTCSCKKSGIWECQTDD